jgi:hypothetical protein
MDWTAGTGGTSDGVSRVNVLRELRQEISLRKEFGSHSMHSLHDTGGSPVFRKIAILRIRIAGRREDFQNV